MPSPSPPSADRDRGSSLTVSGATVLLAAALWVLACTEAAPCDPAAERTGSGDATWYDLEGRGACSVELEGRTAYAAVSTADWERSALCGRCLEVEGPDGSVVVEVLDRCPACGPGDLDLGPDAFERLAPRSRGRIPISWRTVACPAAGPLRIRLEGSDPHYLKLQVTGTRHGVASVDLRAPDGRWRSLRRTGDHHFAGSGALGPPPFELRVHDVHGQELLVPNVALANGVVQTGGGQFAACRESSG